jgi:SatD family (SatD)
MTNKKHKSYAILMGDIVKSSKTKDMKALSIAFNKVIHALNLRFKKHIISPLTITLGDEFQGVIDTTEMAFTIVLHANAELAKSGVTCRYVVALGEIETKINPKLAWNMMGTGLTLARKELSDKSNSNQFRFFLPEQPMTEALNAIGLALTTLENQWTDRQREVVSNTFFSTETRENIAKRLKISRNSLQKTLRAVDYHVVQSLVQTVLKLLRDFEGRRNA